MSDIKTLIEQIQKEAEREPFPIDTLVYEASNLKPTYPILYAGNLKSKLGFFGRDLGRDEVKARQPLYGAAGTLVRQGFYWAIHQEKTNDKKILETICERVLLTNTVPYKPPGNKAYSPQVKERFRPFIEQLLVLHWQGDQIITLGTEAFKWFTPYRKKGELNQFFQRSDRYESQISIIIEVSDAQGKLQKRQFTLLPLPHPSPLNQTYYAKFPQMLQRRLERFDF
jgi:uracil-DNA glycosylase